MLRLTLITLTGLWAAFMGFGRDLSASEQAALDARRDAKISWTAQLSEVATDFMGTGPKRQGDYVPTLAEIGAEMSPEMDAVAPQRSNTDAKIILASASYEDATPSIATTHVTDPEKLIAVLGAAAPAPQEPNNALIREVTASRVNVRSGPSTSFGVMGQVTRSEIVQILSPVENGWVKIIVEGDGVQGYMAANFLTEVTQ